MARTAASADETVASCALLERDVADVADGAPAREAERTARHHLDAHVDVATAPASASATTAPSMSPLMCVGVTSTATWYQRRSAKVTRVTRLVLRGIEAVEARESHHGAAPAANHERAMAAGDGHRHRAEEIGSVHAHRLHLHAEARPRHLAGPDDSREVVAALEANRTIDDGDIAFAAERHRLPGAERLAIEQGRRRRCGACAIVGTSHGNAPTRTRASRRDRRGAALFRARAGVVEERIRGTIASSLQGVRRVKKLVIGCGLAMVLAAIAASAGFYYFVYRPARTFVASMSQLGEVAELDAKVANTRPFTAPADDTLTEAQVKRFVAVQESLHARMGTRATELQAKYKALDERKESGSVALTESGRCVPGSLRRHRRSQARAGRRPQRAGVLAGRVRLGEVALLRGGRRDGHGDRLPGDGGQGEERRPAGAAGHGQRRRFGGDRRAHAPAACSAGERGRTDRRARP